MRIAWRAAGAALLGAALIGCGDAPAPELATVRDSTGVSIVSNPDLSTLAVHATAPEPALRIGVLEGEPEYQLFGAESGLLLDDGRIVLVNAGSSEVRFFDASGTFLTSQGRMGDGPGEYRRPTVIFPFGPDSLGVWDTALRRLTVLDRTGSFGRSVTLSSEVMSPLALGAFSDRTLVVLDQAFDPNAPTDGFEDLPGPVTTHTPAGDPTGDTLSLARWITLHLIVTPTSAEGRGRAFEIAPSRAVTADGLWVGDPRRPEAIFHARDGSGVTRIVRWPDGDRAVTDAHREAFLGDRLASAPNEEVRQALRQTADQQSFAPLLPAFRSMGADADGRLWVRAFETPGVERPPLWTVFDREGRALHRVELPEGATLLWAAGERVLLRVRDELDVERAELRSLAAISPP